MTPTALAKKSAKHSAAREADFQKSMAILRRAGRKRPYKRPILKSHCIACGTVSRLSYAGGVETHTCKKCGCVWEKTRQSTRAALPWAKYLATQGVLP